MGPSHTTLPRSDRGVSSFIIFLFLLSRIIFSLLFCTLFIGTVFEQHLPKGPVTGISRCIEFMTKISMFYI